MQSYLSVEIQQQKRTGGGQKACNLVIVIYISLYFDQEQLSTNIKICFRFNLGKISNTKLGRLHQLPTASLK